MAKKEKDKEKKKKEKKQKRAELGLVAPQLEEAEAEAAEVVATEIKAEVAPAAKKVKVAKPKPAVVKPEAADEASEDNESILAKSRVLRLYTRLMEGKSFNREQAAEEFHCSIRSIQRDIDEIKDYLSERLVEEGIDQELVYDHRVRGYRLNPPMVSMLNNEEAFLILKILLESRVLVKEEMEPIIKRLIDCAVPKVNQEAVKQLIGNERLHYVQPRHGKKVADAVWELGNAIKKQLYVTVEYQKLNGDLVKRKLKPVGVMVSEFYFYLLAFIQSDKEDRVPEADKYPTVYRIDRIHEFKVGRTNFEMPYKAFEEGEFRKRVQFMFTGKLQKIKFNCKAYALEAVLDRLPTAKVLEEKDGVYLLQAEVFGGTGLEMWLRSQGDNVQLVD